MFFFIEFAEAVIFMVSIYQVLVMMSTLSYMREEFANKHISYSERDFSLKAYQSWLVFEIILRVAIMASIMVYIACRSLYRERIVLTFRTNNEKVVEREDPEAVKQARSYEDFLYSAKQYAQIEGAFWTPVFLFLGIDIFCQLFGI